MRDSREGPFTSGAAERPEIASAISHKSRARSSHTGPTRRRGTLRIPRLRVGLVCGRQSRPFANGPFVRRLAFSVLCLISSTATAPAQNVRGPQEDRIILRAYGIPGDADAHIFDLIRLAILDEFKRRHPHVEPVSNQGLNFGHHNPKTQDVGTLMQIAGDIAPHVLPFGFRHTDTYIRSKFLYPLDKYIETMLGLDIEDGPLLDLDEYLARLQTSARYETEVGQRVPYQCWQVLRRQCPYVDDCPHSRKWGVQQSKKHHHVWGFPQRVSIAALFYRKSYFYETGLPDKAPETLEELFDYAKLLTDPEDRRYGLRLGLAEGLASASVSFLYSLGGRLVEENEAGEWRCVFDSEEAVEAYYFLARLFHERYTNWKGKELQGIATDQPRSGSAQIPAMFFYPLQQTYFTWMRASDYGFAPVPRGPTGKRGSPLNATLTGIYAGLEDDTPTRDAAWAYIRFYNGPEARRIRVKMLVENGMADHVHPEQLRRAGFPELADKVPEATIRAYEEALANAVPEPYGTNCGMVYNYLGKALDQIRTSPQIERAVQTGDATRAKGLIRDILKRRVQRSNEKMLNVLTAAERKFRTNVASVVAVVIFVIFVLLFRRVFRVFAAAQIQATDDRRGRWQFGRYKWAYIILIPAVGSIALWSYYPLARGSVMAFQNYNIRGFSEWVGMANFGNVLFDDEFWHAMWVSLKYAVIFAIFGFTSPIVLAFLLTEVPKGKIFFRTVYYLPAVLSGVVVVFLWKGFYGKYGMVNQVLNFFVDLLNAIPGVAIEHVHKAWLHEPAFALLFLLLPVVWVGVGPGCLIYLAALKTVPEELYEAADVDGASIWQKATQVAVPSIKSLIMINFIGVMVATMKGGSEFALAMTGGGPYAPYGATEVVGLHIYWQAFGYLRFGAATAMAWVLGSMLLGFTVVQLQRLSRMEFKTAGGSE